MPTLVIDNGAGNIKAGWSTEKEPMVFDNAKAKHRNSKRTLVGPVIGSTKNKAGLLFKRPFQKGFLIDSELQREIWSTAFGPDCLNVDARETSLLVTEPLFNFAPIQESLQELAFEEFGFESMFRAAGPDLSAYLACKSAGADQGNGGGCVILDSGFSYTNAVPYIDGKRVDAGIRRVDVGGKMLTHHLKDLISYRHVDVSSETYVVNQIKEDVSFVAEDFTSMLKQVSRTKNTEKNPVVVEYELPDFGDVIRGRIRVKGPDGKTVKQEGSHKLQTITLCNERFSVPEVLFAPSDIGMHQAGISAAVSASIAALEPLHQPLAYANIVAIGGNAKMRGFQPRLFAEVRATAPAAFPLVNVTVPDDADWYTWRGGCDMANDDEAFAKRCVTKAEYAEHGHNVCRKRFDNAD